MSTVVDRRAVLGAIGAAIAAGSSADVPAGIAGIVGPAPADPPMKVFPFKWWYSPDDEGVFDDLCATKEEALRLLAEQGQGLIAECRPQEYDLRISGSCILDFLYDQNCDKTYESFLETTPDEVNDLGDMVSAAVEAWAKKHAIDTVAWAFAETRNIIHFGEIDGPLAAQAGLIANADGAPP